MKTILFLLFLACFSLFSKAQKVFSVDYESQADVKVFVVEYASQADLKVFKVDYSSQAGKNDGAWILSIMRVSQIKKYFLWSMLAKQMLRYSLSTIKVNADGRLHQKSICFTKSC